MEVFVLAVVFAVESESGEMAGIVNRETTQMNAEIVKVAKTAHMKVAQVATPNFPLTRRH